MHSARKSVCEYSREDKMAWYALLLTAGSAGGTRAQSAHLR